MRPLLPPNHLFFTGTAQEPIVEVCTDDGLPVRVPLSRAGTGRHGDEGLWKADLGGVIPTSADPWQFRLDLGNGHWQHPEFAPYFTTTLRAVYVQDNQVFGYVPAPTVSPSRVVKIETFEGSLPARPLYVYLPRGYDDHVDKRYPVLYMHDGQNCFEAFVDDSYAGSWQADLAADLVIRQGLMQECIIAGVSNGREERLLEYLPPYSRHYPPPRRPFHLADGHDDEHPPMRRPLQPVPGYAHRTVAYYRDEVAAYLGQHFRTLRGREHTATAGSSFGGLFSAYIAWDHADFARNNAALSSSFWATRTADGSLELVERIRTQARRDLRLWLDCGRHSSPGQGDDGLAETLLAREALLEAGYVEGVDFQFYLDEEGIHSESSWAARLPMIFQFLFPAA
jgi:predicted alpha/beta superfamily hydrolase